jgi:alpha-N-arabinofuranosidase
MKKARAGLGGGALLLWWALAAPSPAVGARLPEFSWDRVPLYMHVRKSTQFTEEEIRYLSGFPLITFEKTTGAQVFGSTEAGTLAAARAVKRLNPAAKILYYRNVIVHYGSYAANAQLEGGPGAFLASNDGMGRLVRNTVEAYDLTNSHVRTWWVEGARQVCADPAIDGVFLDGNVKVLEPAYLQKELGADRKKAVVAGYHELVRATRAAIGPEKLMVANLVRARFPDAGLGELGAFDGSYLEAFETSVGTTKREDYVAKGIAAAQEAARRGKIVAFTAGVGRIAEGKGNNAQETDEIRGRATRDSEVQRRLNYCLAIFLICAEKHSYFLAHDGYDATRSSIWLKRPPEFDRPLGPPRGPARRQGYVYEREFAHASVWLDIEHERARIVWDSANRRSTTSAGPAREYHVAVTGSDANPGTASAPLRTIQRAAELAQPGETITVHGGVYRERINPPRGGTSDEKRIVYQAAPGEKVEIKGSEVVRDWTRVQGDVWKVTLPNRFFGEFNPFSDLINGHWFDPKGRQHHTGAVYLNGNWLTEAAALAEVLAPAGDSPLWFGQVDDRHTTIHAQFPTVDPNHELVEINVRRTVFYPEKPGINYLTVRGFRLTQAATPWAPPTVEQIGLIGTHWSKGWVIEDNTISHSVCAGLTLGLKNMGEFLGNASGYRRLVEYAVEKGGWNQANIGQHVVRRNRVSHCEQAGICGSLGGAFSLIEDNVVHSIHVRRLFHGQEQGGIKLHGAVDTVIRGNLVHDTPRGIWLDWIGQGATISSNLAFNNSTVDLYLEVNHGPILVENNLFLSASALVSLSRGTAYAHNLFAGRCAMRDTPRSTPYLRAHSTEIAGYHDNTPGDERFYNNVFAGVSAQPGQQTASLSGPLEKLFSPILFSGNMYILGAVPPPLDKDPAVFGPPSPNLKMTPEGDGWFLEWSFDPAWLTARTLPLVTTALLGRAKVPDLPFENADGSPLRVDRDYFGKPRHVGNPSPGPFEPRGSGEPMKIKVWPRNGAKS